MKYAELSNNSFEWKNVSLYGIKTYSDPSYNFQGSKPLISTIYAPGLKRFVRRSRYSRGIVQHSLYH